MKYQITQPSDLLNEHGELLQTGYATSPLLKYNRVNVAKMLRLKEWDYYLIYNEDYIFVLTLGNSLGVLLISASVIDLKNMTEQSGTVIRLAPKFRLPESSVTGDIIYKDNKVDLSIVHVNNDRKISLYLTDFLTGADLTASFVLTGEPVDSMVIATPFKENDTYFYYNQKIIGMTASGSVKIKDNLYTFSPDNSFGLLDWGRGVWPYKTTWYWSAAQGRIDNDVFGFNLGYGFGDTKNATENMLFFNGVASKLTKVKFIIPRNEFNEFEYKKTWLFTSEDNRLSMTFHPIYERSLSLSAILISTSQHQVFGKFSGTAVLDDGRTIYLRDFLGFAERVENKW